MRDAQQEEAQGRRHRRIGEFLDALDGGVGLGGWEEAQLTSITIRMPTEADPGALLIVRAQEGDDQRITFVGGYRVGDVVLAWRKRAMDNRMKWRADLPWEERG